MLMERNIPEYTYNINSKRQYDEKTCLFSAVVICWSLILSLPRFLVISHPLIYPVIPVIMI